MSKTRGYKVRAYEGSPWLWVPGTMPDLMLALEECVGIGETQVGETVSIEVVELTDEEIASMPEFEGF